MHSIWFHLLVKLSLFSVMLAIGVNLSWDKLISLWRIPRRLLISLFAVTVIIPLITIVLLSVFPVPTESIIVLAILAASPGASLLTRKSYKAGGHIPYSASIQLTLALVAVIITPLTLSIFYYFLEFNLGEISLFDIAKQVLRVQFLPVILGLLIQKLLPEITNKYGKSLILLANSLLILLNLVILPVAISLLIHLDIWPL